MSDNGKVVRTLWSQLPLHRLPTWDTQLSCRILFEFPVNLIARSWKKVAVIEMALLR